MKVLHGKDGRGGQKKNDALRPRHEPAPGRLWVLIWLRRWLESQTGVTHVARSKLVRRGIRTGSRRIRLVQLDVSARQEAGCDNNSFASTVLLNFQAEPVRTIRPGSGFAAGEGSSSKEN